MSPYDKVAPFSAVSEHNRIELFKQAKEYFEKNPGIQKLSRQDIIPSITIPIENSMIKIDGPPGILMLSANKECNIIGAGASGRVKFGIDEAGKLYAVKIVTEKKAPLSFSHSLSDDEFDESKPQGPLLSSMHRALIDEHKKLLNLQQAVGESPMRREKNVKEEKFYVVEHYLGMSLTQYLKKDAGSLEQRLELAIALTEKVVELHQGKLSTDNTPYAHGDLKPDNIVLNESNDELNLIDFGSAMVIDPSDQLSYQAKGSPAYMPCDLAKLNEGGRAALYDCQKQAQKALDTHGPVFFDMIGLLRTIYVSPLLSNKGLVSILTDAQFNTLPQALQKNIIHEQLIDIDPDYTPSMLLADLEEVLTELKQNIQAQKNLKNDLQSIRTADCKDEAPSHVGFQLGALK